MTVPPYARRHLPAGLEEQMLSGRRQQLARVANSVTEVPVEWKLLVGRPATVLVQEVLRSNHDVLIRSHARDLTTPGPTPFGAVDMELLRTCPCPVLLARHGRPASHPRVAAAANASTDETVEEALNKKIVELALQVASSLDAGSTTLLHVWKPFAERMIRSHAGDDQFSVYVESARHREAAALSRLAQSFESGGARLQPTLRRGEPADVIPEFVVAEGIDLVVMGTVARAGIAGMLIGNTAERILRRLPCSVLAVKPDGFVSPVRLDAS
jgi:nucleotide-binding universal stress UspA family protein